MTLTEWLAADPARCDHGYRRKLQACPDCRARIDAAIRTVAARGEAFSANDVRALVLDVTGPLMGARFLAAANAGLIVKVGYTQSTKANTHAHPVAMWRAA